MLRFTIFRIQQPSILHIDFARRMREIALFSQVINGHAAATEIKHTQVMTAALKERIPQLNVIGERSYNIIKFFNEIPLDQKFLIIPGHLDDELECHRYLAILYQMNGISQNYSEIDRIASYLWDHYEVRIYKGEDRRNIGVYDKPKRKCRFCGKRMPEVSFKHRSHAISEALGNKGLICLEECDNCNKRFNESIEQDLTHMMTPYLMMHNVSGKNGIPEIKGNGFLMRIDTINRETLGRDTIVYTLRDMPNCRNPKEVLDGISKDYSVYLHFTPQNVYKCLCKFALSLMDSSELEYFQETIAWINEPLTKHRLPPIWRYSVSREGKTWEQTTSMIIMRRKHAGKDLPYCWAIIIIAGDPYLFVVPFCSQDKYKFVGQKRQAYFLNGIKNMMNGMEFHPMNMNRTLPVRMKIRQSFEISPDCQEGRDFKIIEPT